MGPTPHREPPADAASNAQMRAYIRDHDWQSTPMGPIESWPAILRTAVDLMLDSAQAVYIAWGPDLISLYNDGYLPFLGEKHPHALGQPFRVLWSEIWDEFRPIAAAVMAGESRSFVDHPVPITGRPGRPMSWFTFSWTPLRDDTGAVGGFYCTAIETTARVLAERSLQQVYGALFDSINEAFCIIEVLFDADGVPHDYLVLDTNPAFIRHTGLVDAVGKRMRELAPEHERFWYDTYGRIALSGHSERFTHRAQALGRWYNVHAFRIGLPAERRVAVLFDDITEQKTIEQALRDNETRRAFLLELSDGFRMHPQEQAVAACCVMMTARHLRVDRCCIVEVPGDLGRVIAGPEYHADDLPPMAGAYSRAMYPDAVRRLEERRPLVCGDIANDATLAAIDRASIRKRLGLGALLAAPVRGTGSTIWALLVGTVAPRAWSDEELQLLQDIGERTWAAIERARVDEAQRSSEARLREREAELARVQRIGGVGGINIDVLGGLRGYRSPEYLKLHGLPPDTVEETHADWLARLHPDDRVQAEQALFAALDSSETGYELEYRIVRPSDGEVRWIAARADIERNAEGKAARLIGAHVDISEQKRAQAAVLESEERFRQFAHASASGLWIRDAGTLAMEYMSPAMATIYGVAPDAFLGDVSRWAAVIVPEDRARALEHVHMARRGESVVHEFRVQRVSDRAFRWIRNTDFPLHDGAHVRRIAGIAEDVTEMRLAVEHQGVLLAELQHRVRNIMAIIRAIVSRTADSVDSIEEYAQVLAGRLDTFARVQALLTRGANVGVSLSTIVHEELSALAHHQG